MKLKLHELTGLRLNFSSEAHPDELLTDSNDLLYDLNKTEDPWINAPRFKCDRFDDVHLGEGLDPKSKSFYLEYGLRMPQMYFYEALIKTMLELGGQTFNFSIYPHEEDLEVEKYLCPYLPHERKWKRIKKWHEMSHFEQVNF